jgi:PAS domain-containing protein
MISLWNKTSNAELDTTAEYLRWSTLAGAIIMAGFLYQAPRTSGDHVFYVTLMRVIGALVGIGFWYLSRNLRVRPFITYITIMFYTVYPLITIAIIYPRPQPYSLLDHSAMTSILILLLGIYIFSNLRFVQSFLVGSLTIGYYTSAVYLAFPAQFTYFRSNILVDILVIVFGLAIKGLCLDNMQRKLEAAYDKVDDTLASVDKEVSERAFELQLTKPQLAAALNAEKNKDNRPSSLRDLTHNLIIDSAKVKEDLLFYSTIAEHSNTPICCLNTELKVIWANSQMVKFSGYTLKELYLANSITSFVADESKDYVRAELTRLSLIADADMERFNFYFISATKDNFLCEVKVSSSDIETIGIVLVLTMCTFIERRSIERVNDMDRVKDRRIQKTLIKV